MLVIRPLAYFFLFAHIIFTAITFGGAIYETMVINSVWYSNLPDSLRFMTNPEYSVKPGRFWQAFGPVPGSGDSACLCIQFVYSGSPFAGYHFVLMHSI